MLPLGIARLMVQKIDKMGCAFQSGDGGCVIALSANQIMNPQQLSFCDNYCYYKWGRSLFERRSFLSLPIITTVTSMILTILLLSEVIANTFP